MFSPSISDAINPEAEVESANIYWRLPDTQAPNPRHITLEKFGKSVKRVFRQYKSTSNFDELFSLEHEECAEKFLKDFFLSCFDEQEIDVNLANLSLEDNSDKRIALAIRIPEHPVFVKSLPRNIAICVLGYCPTSSHSPIFVPEKVFLTHSEFEPTDYESQLSVKLHYLESSAYPPRDQKNALMPNFIKSLPKFGVETNKRLKGWLDFLKFKENLIKHKTQGLRYLKRFVDNEKGQVSFLVIAEDTQVLKLARNAFRRQNLHAFDLKVSTDPCRFTLPKNDDRRDNKREGSAFGNLGQMVNNGLKPIKKNQSEKELVQQCEALRSLLIKDNQDSDFNFRNAEFALLDIELSEDLNNRIARLDDDPINEDGESLTRQDKIDEIFKKLPETGFLSISLIGDLAQINRHRRAVFNLRQNEGCYAPYLSSYLFDIKNANQPDEIPEITEWENKDLNQNQKQAVQKMLAAPDICLIQGPPGTGKTTVIAEACLQFAKRGETVLLASQAHDALDNALSKLQNNPTLRAMRLARNASRITDDGKEFAGESVLTKHYLTLKHHLTQEYLQPQDDLVVEIEKKTDWLNKAQFIAGDLEKLRASFVANKENLQQAKKDYLIASDEFAGLQVQYQQKQKEREAQQHLANFLQSKLSLPALSGIELNMPDFVYPLANALANLTLLKIRQTFSYRNFELEKENQLGIFASLYEQWQNLEQIIPKMQLDLDKLSASQSGQLIDVQVQLQMEVLQKEINELNNRLLDEDDDNLVKEWRQKKRELRALQQEQTVGLNAEDYQLFIDIDCFTQTTDMSLVREHLSHRLLQLKPVQEQINSLTKKVIEDLKAGEQQILLTQPDESAMQLAKTSLDKLLEQELSIKKQGQKKREQANQLLALLDGNESQKIEDVVRDEEEKLTHAKKQLEELKRQNKDFQPLFESWRAILKDANKRAKSDWSELEKTYIESANLIAISCNEDERTLTDLGFDGFDVVIIDEVSKATPLELLLPLMRAKKAILVGDHRQLPPVFNEADGLTFEDEVERNEAEAEEEGESSDVDLTQANLQKFEKMVTASLFKELFEQAPDSLRERLTVQFRMHPDIMKMVNFFYEGQLECGNPNKDRSHGLEFRVKEEVYLRKSDHLLWVDTTNDDKGKRFSIDPNKGNINELEAKMIAHTLVEMDKQLQQTGLYHKEKKLKVGVVSFYQPQCRVIRDEIRAANNRDLRFEAIDVEINTVIRYQGKQKPIILLSLVKNNGKDRSQRFRPGRANIARYEFINVAMSRTQNLLMVFGARNMLENRDVKLPKMNKSGHVTKAVYKNMFSYLKFQAQSGQLCDASEFAQTLPTLQALKNRDVK